ncbi:immune inhibitor A [Candidatus Saganbacteria bacterium]|nr:immune inhibitor A [Candidatus Saganbacteria bacterium]
MRKEILFSFVLMGMAIFFAGCSTAPASQANKPILQSVLISPEAVAPNSFILFSVNALDSDGNKLFYKIGTGETLALAQNKKIVFQAPSQAGTSEMDFIITNGREDVYKKVKICVDSGLPSSTIKYGRATLPLGKSFDFFNGTVVDRYYGDMDYLMNYSSHALYFDGDRNGSTVYVFDGGLVDLTYFNPEVKDLSQVVEKYSGSYYSIGYNRADEGEYKLKIGDVYCILLKYSNNFFGKIKIISIDAENIVFDYAFQKTPDEIRFYDYAPSTLVNSSMSAPLGLVGTVENTTASISWGSNNEPNLMGYQIYRSISSESGFAKIRTVGLTNEAVDAGLGNDKTYYYKIKAINNVYTESDYSNEICITTESSTASTTTSTSTTTTTTTSTTSTTIPNFTDNAESGLDKWNVSGFSVSNAAVHSGSSSFYSGAGNNLNNTLTIKNPIVIASTTETLSFWTYYRSEVSYDNLIIELSENGSSWTIANFYSGSQLSWIQKSINLSSYAGKTIYLRFRYKTDGYIYYDGFYIDDIAIEG